jgi:hypothetical protein
VLSGCPKSPQYAVHSEMKLAHNDNEPDTLAKELTDLAAACENNPVPIIENSEVYQLGPEETPVLIEEPQLPQKRYIGEQQFEPAL